MILCPNPKLYKGGYLEAGRTIGDFGIARVFDGIYVIDSTSAHVSNSLT